MKREGVWLDGRWIDRDQVEQCKELVEEMRGKREQWERQKELVTKALGKFRVAMQRNLAPAFERMRQIHGELLDARIKHGFYEEDLAESHGHAEDVFI